METLRAKVEKFLMKDDTGEHFVKFAGHVMYSVFQEIYAYKDGETDVYGCEALFRLTQNPEGITPLDFLLSLPNDEHNLFDRVLRAAHIRNFMLSDLSHLRVFINVDAASYANEVDLVEGFNLLLYRLGQLGLNPKQIVFEFIETPCYQDEHLAEIINNLREVGIGIAVDDYGIKYSSLERVKQLKPDIVKFDRLWLVNARDSKEQRDSYLRNVDLIRNLGMQVLLEGVELEKDLEIVDMIQPDYVQGFFYAKPRPIKIEKQVARALR